MISKVSLSTKENNELASDPGHIYRIIRLNNNTYSHLLDLCGGGAMLGCE